MGKILLALGHVLEAVRPAASPDTPCPCSLSVPPHAHSQANPGGGQTGLFLVLREASHFVLMAFACLLRSVEMQIGPVT